MQNPTVSALYFSAQEAPGSRTTGTLHFATRASTALVTEPGWAVGITTVKSGSEFCKRVIALSKIGSILCTSCNLLPGKTLSSVDPAISTAQRVQKGEGELGVVQDRHVSFQSDYRTDQQKEQKEKVYAI